MVQLLRSQLCNSEEQVRGVSGAEATVVLLPQQAAAGGGAAWWPLATDSGCIDTRDTLAYTIRPFCQPANRTGTVHAGAGGARAAPGAHAADA